MQSPFQAAHIGNMKRTEIENGAGAFRDDIGARAAFDGTGVDGDAATKIVPFFDASKLLSQLVNSVSPFFRREAGMRSAAVHNQFRFADALARSFQQAARAEGRLKNKDRIAAPRFCFEEFAGRLAADLFIGGPQKDDTLAPASFVLLKRLQCEKRLNDAGLHVKGARSVSSSRGDAEGHLPQRPGGIDGVVMAENHELPGRTKLLWPVSDAEMIAPMLLSNPFDARASLPPFFGDKTAATICGCFFKTG